MVPSSYSPGNITSSLDLGQASVPHKDGGPDFSALSTLIREVSHVITCLQNLLEVILSAVNVRVDYPIVARSIDIGHYQLFDLQHVRHKFPVAETWLAERLGKANSRRRQYFIYAHRKVTEVQGLTMMIASAEHNIATVYQGDSAIDGLLDVKGPSPNSSASSSSSSSVQVDHTGHEGRRTPELDEASIKSITSGTNLDHRSLIRIDSPSHAIQDELQPLEGERQLILQTFPSPDHAPQTNVNEPALATEAFNVSRVLDDPDSASDTASYTDSEYSTAISSYTGLSTAKLTASLPDTALQGELNTPETAIPAEQQIGPLEAPSGSQTTIHGLQLQKGSGDLPARGVDTENTGSDDEEDDVEDEYFTSDGAAWLMNAGHEIRVPEPPVDDDLHGQFFECPYCRSLVAFKTIRAW